MSGAYSDEKPHKTSETFNCSEIFVLGTFHATTLCLSSPSRQISVFFFESPRCRPSDTDHVHLLRCAKDQTNLSCGVRTL